MKRRLICCAAFLLLGAGAFCAGWFFREVSAFLEVEREASYAEAHRLLLRCRLEIPGDLRALNVFSYDAGWIPNNSFPFCRRKKTRNAPRLASTTLAPAGIAD